MNDAINCLLQKHCVSSVFVYNSAGVVNFGFYIQI
jgi:hypothetical protein